MSETGTKPAKKLHLHSWTPEKLRARTRAEVENIRLNAHRLGATDLVELCDGDLRLRAPVKQKRSRQPQAARSATDFVSGYHFVCARDRGVLTSENGRFWTGSWVVAEDNVQDSLKYGAYLALHEAKSAPSYRQGRIVDYRRAPRDMLPAEETGREVRRGEGIEFLVQESREAYAWVGDGSGEKGYRWSSTSTVLGTDQGANETSAV